LTAGIGSERHQRSRVPGGMHHAQVIARQGQRQTGQKLRKLPALVPACSPAVLKPARGVIVIVSKEPAIARFGCATQHTEFMIAEHALRLSGCTQRLHQLDHARTVGAAIAEITDEDQVTPIAMLPVVVIAKVLQQCMQRFEFTVYVADDVERAGSQRCFDADAHSDRYRDGVIGRVFAGADTVRVRI
jgi:hypothetical protein